tara:strand:+ start:2216 stop:2827 length:612 start_codon:yes stop_codon:yes gene_type:complete
MLVDDRSFGIVIAFVIPGWIALLGLAPFVPLFDQWLSGPLDESPTVGGFLYSLLASIALGIFASTLRWLAVDSLIAVFQPTKRAPDFGKLRDAHDAMRVIIEGQYRFYQFYGNGFIAILAVACARWFHHSFDWSEFALFALIGIILLLGARDTKHKYDVRLAQLLPTTIEDQKVNQRRDRSRNSNRDTKAAKSVSRARQNVRS